ncbi:MAG TPA: hypothetical protein DEP84_32515 [Chloroflexi bacterium]|nr:hypothetical protein [Chloroflexota bacterium]
MVSLDLPAPAVERAGFIPVEVSSGATLWAADATRLTYAVHVPAAQALGLWMRDLATGEERLLLPYVPGQTIISRGLSPAGRLLAYQIDDGLFVLEVDSSATRLLVEDLHYPQTGEMAIHFYAWVPAP